LCHYSKADMLLYADRGATLPQESTPELAATLAHYRTAEAVADYSVYRFYPGEHYLYSKYYKAGENVLDLACGLGRTTLLLHEMGLAVRGVDISEIFVEIAKRRLPYLDLRIGSYSNIDEADSSFAHVLISHNGIDCAFPETQRVQALRECARVLKPGGTLIYSSHNLKSLHWFSPYYRDRLKWKLSNTLQAFREKAYILEETEYIFYSTPEYVIRQTEAAGLRLLEMKGFGRFGSKGIDAYFSPYLHYVFEKPLG
jgi:ubiquinone/menaquinone biosynthesis C-methylase UbiE